MVDQTQQDFRIDFKVTTQNWNYQRNSKYSYFVAKATVDANHQAKALLVFVLRHNSSLFEMADFHLKFIVKELSIRRIKAINFDITTVKHSRTLT